MSPSSSSLHRIQGPLPSGFQRDQGDSGAPEGNVTRQSASWARTGTPSGKLCEPDARELLSQAPRAAGDLHAAALRLTWFQVPEVSAWARPGTFFQVNFIRPTCTPMFCVFQSLSAVHGKENENPLHEAAQGVAFTHRCVLFSDPWIYFSLNPPTNITFQYVLVHTGAGVGSFWFCLQIRLCCVSLSWMSLT